MTTAHEMHGGPAGALGCGLNWDLEFRKSQVEREV